MSNRTKLLEGDTGKVFLKYLIPAVGGMLGTSLYVLGDTMVVGQGLGSQGLAALNVSIPIINVFNGMGLLFGIGGATAISINRGRRDEEGLNDIFSKSMIMAFIIGAIITIIRILFLDEFVSFLGASEASFQMSKDYLGILMFFSIAFLLNVSLTVHIRNDGAPRLAMAGMLTGSIMNVILDYIFVFKFNWGMSGVGLATGFAPVIGLIILGTHFIRKKNQIKFIIPKVNWSIVKRIIVNGGASFIVEISAGIVIFTFNKVLSDIAGDIGITAYSIVANLSLIFAAIFIGLGQAIQPIVSINYGANKMNRVYEFVKMAILTSFILGGLFYSLGLFFPEFLISIFIDANAELMKIATRGIRIYFLSFVLMGVNIVLTSFIQSKEYGRTSLIISLSRGFIFVILILMILPKIIGIDGVWLTLPLAELITSIISLIYFKKYRKAVQYTINR